MSSFSNRTHNRMHVSKTYLRSIGPCYSFPGLAQYSASLDLCVHAVFIVVYLYRNTLCECEDDIDPLLPWRQWVLSVRKLKNFTPH